MKKRMIKSFLSLLLIFTMLLGNMTVFAAEQGAASDPFYRTGEKEVQVYKIDDADVTEVSKFAPDLAGSPYWSQFSTKYYYNQMSAAKKQAWDELENICVSYLEGNANARYIDYLDIYITDFASVPSMTDAEFVTFVKLFRYCNPQYYFLDLDAVTNGDETKIALVIYPAFANASARAVATQQFRSAVDSWLACVNSAARPEQIEQSVTDVIATNIYYNENTYDQSAYSAFVIGETVCAGYAMAFQMLALGSGLEAIPVYGTVDSTGHAWNKIKLYGNWYVVDETWNDLDPAVYYKYYNKSDADSGRRVNDSGIAAWVPASPYSSTATQGSYEPAYFNVSDIVYFSVSGKSPYYAWAVDAGPSTQMTIPSTVSYNGNTYTVLGADNVVNTKNFIVRLYWSILDRKADAEGLNNWTNNFMDGTLTSADCVYGLVTSQEFINKGFSNEEVIEEMYYAMLGRYSDPAGKEYWMARFNAGMSVASIVNGFSGSAEYAALCSKFSIPTGAITALEPRDVNYNVTAFAHRCYSKALGRTPDVGGLNNWCNALLSGARTPIQVAEEFVFSTEVNNKNLSNADFVEMLYQFCLGRNSDSVGKADWVGQLNSGVSRKSVFNGFAYSAEFAEIIASFGL